MVMYLILVVLSPGYVLFLVDVFPIPDLNIYIIWAELC